MAKTITDTTIDKLQSLSNYFKSGKTKDYSFRKQQLLNLKKAILDNEEELYKCLYTDLKKSNEEVWVTETGFVLTEINDALKHVKQWMSRKKAGTNLLNFPSSSYIIPEPLGVVLIIAPWNYPLQLLLTPLIGAIAAGNCVVLKPSEFAPATAAVLKKIIESTFAGEYILYVEGEGAVVIPQMMRQFTFNHVFYTGSTAIGKTIYKMAAERLMPVTLELGGKSPCIIESDANIKVAAKRVAMTKFSNAGQMCVAPDYVLVHSSVKQKFIQEISAVVEKFFTKDPLNNPEYGKIINEKQFDRLAGYLNEGNIMYGGNTNREKLFIQPTIIDSITGENKLMQEEIFGPILPVISFDTIEEAKTIIEKNADPLALYVYTGSRQRENYWLNNIAFGGGCINNSSWHLTNYNLPFGGRGFSGIGKYHGKYTFETFSHYKAIMKTPTWLDPALRYPPFKGKLNLFKKIIG
jgi:aldehyde dehydrogenase (NAD+)